MSAQLNGAEQILARLRQLAVTVPQNVRRALYQEALEIQRVSMRRTPVDTGALRASHETKVGGLGAEAAATISVGGPAAPYALIVHEDLMAFHKVGGPKFLETAMHEAAPELPQRLRDRLSGEGVWGS